MLPMILNIVDMTGGTTNAPYMILNIVDMTGGTTNAPYDPKDDEGGFGDVGRIMQVYIFLFILLYLSVKGALSVIKNNHNCTLKTFV